MRFVARLIELKWASPCCCMHIERYEGLAARVLADVRPGGAQGWCIVKSFLSTFKKVMCGMHHRFMFWAVSCARDSACASTA